VKPGCFSGASATKQLVLLALLSLSLLAAAGCSGGVSEGTNLDRGRELFINGDGDTGEPTCGSCHTLAAAGTTGTAGPDLDGAFAASRLEGFEESTFEQVVREQIALPGAGLGMPADLVTGEDADNVAFFVASCAANEADPVCAPPQGGGGGVDATSGEEVFAQAGCGSCHTLAAASASGTIGPNLDDAKPPRSLVVDRVTNGAGQMPAFKDQLSEDQIQAVADFVSENAGG
jgi:mono/diheme cytochrome c family protein